MTNLNNLSPINQPPPPEEKNTPKETPSLPKKELSKDDKPLPQVILETRVPDHEPTSLSDHNVSASPPSTKTPILTQQDQDANILNIPSYIKIEQDEVQSPPSQSPETHSPRDSFSGEEFDVVQSPLSQSTETSTPTQAAPTNIPTSYTDRQAAPTNIPTSYSDRQASPINIPTSYSDRQASPINIPASPGLDAKLVSMDAFKENKEKLISLMGDHIFHVRDSSTGEEFTDTHKDFMYSPLILKFEGDEEYYASIKNAIQTMGQEGKNEAANNLEVLGSGQYKVAFKINIYMRDKGDELFSLVLSTNKSSERPDRRALAAQENEFKILLKNIPGALPNYGLLQLPNTGNFVLISKFCSEGSLKGYFQSIGQSDDKKVLILKQCWDKLAIFHQAGFSHRDIKMSNFFVHKNSKNEIEIYLGDLGLACASNSPKVENCNLTLLPPFIFKENPAALSHPKIDNWAFGLMICNLLRSSHPEIENFSFDADAPNLNESAKKLPWLAFYKKNKNDIYEIKTVDGKEIKVTNEERVQTLINDFIDATFEKAAFSSNKEAHQKLKYLVMALMNIDPQKILGDEAISTRLIRLYKTMGLHPDQLISP